jgi:tol-pal system protein YbgF
MQTSNFKLRTSHFEARNRIATIALTLVIALAIASEPAAAQNRAELQMNADLRMLQEQVSKLQLTVNQLGEQLKATNKRIDDSADANVKAFANHQLLISNITTSLRTMSEKIDESSGRVSKLSQEFTAIRDGVRMLTDQINVLVSLLQPPPVNPTNPDAPTSGGTGPLAPIRPPTSASSYFQQAENDYRGGRWDSAIEGFRELIQKFPTAPDAADAQFFIGEALYQQKKYAQAIPEYQKVIDNYKTSDWLPDAHLMQAKCYLELNQRAQAQKMLELVRNRFPNTPQAIQATQELRGMGAIK